jgi:hypothetical protein
MLKSNLLKTENSEINPTTTQWGAVIPVNVSHSPYIMNSPSSTPNKHDNSKPWSSPKRFKQSASGLVSLRIMSFFQV